MVSTTKINLDLHKKLLRFTGISLNEREPIWYHLYSFIIICFMLSYPVTIFHAAFTNHSGMEILLEIAYGTAGVNACSKILATFRVRKQLGKALSVLHSNVLFSPNVERGGPEEEVLMNECTFYVNGQVMVLCAIAIGNLGGSTAESLIPRLSYNDSHYWELPYGGFSVFNTTYSPNFEAALTYQVAGAAVVCMGFVTVTTFIAGVMAYVACQLKMLQHFIKNAISYTNKRMKEDNQNIQLYSDISDFQWKYLKQTTKEIVEYHSAIIEIAEKFEQLLNLPALVDFLGLSFVICVALFNCTVVQTFNLRLINQLLLAGGNIFLQFITAYWGDQVITESEAVATACYEADFIGTDLRFQKGWIAIMERSQRRIEFTVGTFAPLSLNTFQVVIKTSYSYFMMLYNFNKKIIMEE